MRSFFVMFLVAWIVGIALGVYRQSPAIITIITVALVLLWLRLSSQSSSLPVMSATAALALLGWVRGTAVPWHPAPCQLLEPVQVIIVTIDRTQEQSVRYLARSNEHCLLLVTAGRFPLFEAGQIVELKGNVEAVSKVAERYPGYADYLWRQGIVYTARYPDITVVGQHSTWLGRLRAAARRQVDTIFTEPEASLVAAMVLAQRGTVPDTITERFQATGVSHVLAISGLHISLIAGMLVVSMLALPLSPAWRTLIVVVVLWFYATLIGAPASVVRATAFWTITLLAWRWRLLISLPTVLLLAAAAMVSLEPLVIKDVGWQLSFSAVGGIGLILFLTKNARWGEHLGTARAMALVSAGATLGTWPLVAHYFGVVSVVSLLANVLVVPAVPFLLAVSMLSIIASLIAPAVAVAGAYLVHLLWRWMDIVTSLLASLPGGWVHDLYLPVWLVAVYYAALLVGAVWIVKYQQRSWREVWQ